VVPVVIRFRKRQEKQVTERTVLESITQPRKHTFNFSIVFGVRVMTDRIRKNKRGKKSEKNDH